MTTSETTTPRINRLNHAVLYVRNVERSAQFYRDAFGFETVMEMSGRAAFLRAPGTDNHHDLGLFAVGEQAPAPPRGAPGLYHLAWQVDTIEDLVRMANVLVEMDALVGASDHGATKSLYGQDPDGIEFEVMWLVPRDAWGDYEHSAVTQSLNLQAELDRWGAAAR